MSRLLKIIRIGFVIIINNTSQSLRFSKLGRKASFEAKKVGFLHDFASPSRRYVSVEAPLELCWKGTHHTVAFCVIPWHYITFQVINYFNPNFVLFVQNLEERLQNFYTLSVNDKRLGSDDIFSVRPQGVLS